MPFDKDYTLRYLAQKPRYHKYHYAISPKRVQQDPWYDSVVFVILPFDLPFDIHHVHWNCSRLTHRLPITVPDKLEFFAVMSAITEDGSVSFRVMFVGQEVFVIFRKWLYFLYEHHPGVKGKNVMQAYYQKVPAPIHPPGYDRTVLDYGRGAVFADHQHLRRILTGITI